MIRRTFLSLGLMLLGTGRRAWAQVASSPRFARLTTPIRLPLESVTTPWQAVSFTAEGISPATETQSPRRVLLSGVLFRRSTAPPADALSALCLTCPHEQCRVELITDAVRLARIEGAAGHPVFLCGCHESAFDAMNAGAWLAGPAPRGLYQFRITAVRNAEVEIGEVEALALSEV